MSRKIKFLVLSFIIVGITGATAVATTIDLTTTGSSGTATAAIGGTFKAFWMDQQSTGTGVIDPFSRLQAGGNEQGYNSSLAQNLPLDEKAGIWTHALPLDTVPIFNIGGILYREFILDINEDRGSNHELLSLNQIQIFLGADTLAFTLTPASTTTDPLISFGAGYNEVFRMNNLNASGATRNVIEMNYLLNPGSGAGDMDLFVRNDIFGGATTGNVILYSQFGDPRGQASSSDGFEEWAVRVGGTPPEVPEPISLILLGSGLVGAGLYRKLRKPRG